jgi:hypothetical protein
MGVGRVAGDNGCSLCQALYCRGHHTALSDICGGQQGKAWTHESLATAQEKVHQGRTGIVRDRNSLACKVCESTITSRR